MFTRTSNQDLFINTEDSYFLNKQNNNNDDHDYYKFFDDEAGPPDCPQQLLGIHYLEVTIYHYL